MDLNNTLNKRPASLKALCILSFIGCGLQILLDFFSIIFSFNPGFRDMALPGNDHPVNQVIFFITHSGNQHLKDLIVEIVSLAGVILMWKLKKTGFIIYLIAESFLYFEFVHLILTTSFNFSGVAVIASEMLWPLPFDIAFFILYAVQLKFMTWKWKLNYNP